MLSSGNVSVRDFHSEIDRWSPTGLVAEKLMVCSLGSPWQGICLLRD
jgi:hypothetical protein